MTEETDKTVIAIDYGERRIGLAKTDPTRTICSALDTLTVKSAADGMQQVRLAIETWSPQALVVGYPLNDDGTPSDKCEIVDRFIAQVKTWFEGPIYRVDEFGSSQEAAALVHRHGKQAGRDKPRLDRLSAVVILERFLTGRYEVENGQ